MLGLSANEVTPHHAVWKHIHINSAALLALLSHAGKFQKKATGVHYIHDFEGV